MSEKIEIEKLDFDNKKLYFMEAFLKRLALVEGPFALKGSLLTRQYLEDESIRKAQDMDFLCTKKIDDKEDAYNLFSEWLNEATKINFEDGVIFSPFEDYTDWVDFSYETFDDFETVNTEVEGKYIDKEGKGSHFSINIDISFDFQTTAEIVPLTYKSEFFGDIPLKKTIPLPIQIAWKLHQTIISPRFKDIVDLCYLIENPLYKKEDVETTLREVKWECDLLHLNQNAPKLVLIGDLSRVKIRSTSYNGTVLGKSKEECVELIKNYKIRLRKAMDDKGFNQEIFYKIF